MRFLSQKFVKSALPYAALLGLSLLAHLPGLTSPLLDYQAYRQCQTASMARNYVRHGMHFLNPELDTEGRPVRAGTEFPLYSYLVAILWKLFGVREILGRMLSTLFGAWGAVFLYLFARPRLGEARALGSALVLCVLPIHIFFTRTVQPEPMALWGLLGFLYYWDRWFTNRHPSDWILAVFLGALAPLLKLPFLYLLIPLWAYRCWEAYGWTFFTRAGCLGGLAVMVSVTWLWYHYAKTAPVGILPLSATEHLQNMRSIGTFNLWRNHFISRLPELCLTYPGLIFAALGVYQLRQEKKLRFWGIWFATTALYIVLLGEYGLIHRYTELPFAPINAVLIGSGIWAAWTKARTRMWKIIWTVLVIGIPVHAGLRIAHWYRWEYPWVFEARQTVAQFSGANDLVITNTREHPVLLYYIQRYGFAPALEETGLDVLRGYRAQGASLFLTPADEGWARHPEWQGWFAKNAQLLAKTPDFLVYRLREKI